MKETFKKYEALSGMVLSREKTKILGFGEWEGRHQRNQSLWDQLPVQPDIDHKRNLGKM